MEEETVSIPTPGGQMSGFFKHWARPLGIPAGKITYHVLEAPDPAAAIIRFARSNHVDQIVIGSRGRSTSRRYLGSVSSLVVARAHCTVTVVKAPETAGHPGEPASAGIAGPVADPDSAGAATD